MQLAVTATSNQAAASDSIPVKKVRVFFVAIAVLALCGTILSAVSLQRHYAKSESKFCEFGEKFNCDIVNRSEYSSVMGIPVAAIGLVGYGVLAALATIYRARRETPTRQLSVAIAGLAFALYLTYIEAYVLDTWCILCLSSLATIVAITVLASLVRARVH
jgi:vitamin-K-epoxide reductase (warfarin-sensitive)